MFENEPAMAPDLADMPNAVIVPHIASASEWTRSGMVGLPCACMHACVMGRASCVDDYACVCCSLLPAIPQTSLVQVMQQPARRMSSRNAQNAHAPTPRKQATLAAANVAGILQGYGAWSNPNDITPFLDGPMASLPRAAPSIVNAKEINLATA